MNIKEKFGELYSYNEFSNAPDEGEWYGTKYHSGRYPYGSGEDPFQHDENYLRNYNDLRSQGLTDKDIVEKRRKEIIDEYTAKGMTYEAARHFAENKISVAKLQTELRIAKRNVKAAEVDKIKHLLKDHGNNVSEVARILGINESSVRSKLNSTSEERLTQMDATAEMLKGLIEQKGKNIDVGKGMEIRFGVSRATLDDALYMLQLEGYEVYGGRMDQPNNPNSNHKTTLKILCPPGTAPKAAYDLENVAELDLNDLNYISPFDVTSHDGGKTFDTTKTPESIDSSRVGVRYAEDGGKLSDGTIILRRGVKDVSLGDPHYAQVRIGVDGTHYIKGMAFYGDDEDFPPGVDIIINSNKKEGTPLLGPDNEHSVTKKFKVDKATGEVDKLNPFGALIPAKGQTYYEDPNGKYEIDGKLYSISTVNKVRSEGEWNAYSNSLASQMLGKQPKEIISKQLDMTYDFAVADYEEIISLTNPTIRKNRLEKFADECDTASYELKAAAFPRQSWQVILPVNSLKDNEIYAPGYKDGEEVILVRYPHGGTFEIPRLTVNNRNTEGNKILGKNAKDAVGINKNVADILSGADFDGDTVLVIPVNKNVKLVNQKPLPELANFDTKDSYPGYPGMKVMKDTQKQMGVISNLITDMTIKGASPEELARATKHSMVVIDAEKHELDYRKSYQDNRIAELKAKYQGHYDEDGKYHEGATTLLSRANKDVDILETKGSPSITAEGDKVIKNSGREYLKAYIDVYNPKTGRTKKKEVSAWKKDDGIYYKDENKQEVKVPEGTKIKRALATQKTQMMLTVDDARKLYSDKDNPAPQEVLYADYANKMKTLAKKARKEAYNVKETNRDPEMAKLYAEEVASLKAKLTRALSNASYEREAQRRANVVLAKKRKANGDLSSSELKKIGQKALEQARADVGAHSARITSITDREWEAIQKGAIGHSTLNALLNNMDDSLINKLAMPKTTATMSNANQTRLKSMYASGNYTISEMCDKFNISKSTLYKYVG